MSGPLVSASAAFVAKNSRKPPFAIEQSLRFDGSSYLRRDPGSNGNFKTNTISVWIKQSAKDAAQSLFGQGRCGPRWSVSSNVGEILHNAGVGGTNNFLYSNGRYRDPSAWYHLVIIHDTTQATESDRVRIYINGTEIAFSSASYPGQNADMNFNNTEVLTIGRGNVSDTEVWLGYMAEYQFIDGSAVEPDQFAETDDNGVWRPIAYTGSYGTTGYYLKFDPTATNGVGHDHSGNGNNFTANNFTTSGTGTDVMDDTPTTNWCTLNPIYRTPPYPTQSENGTLSDGNLAITFTGVNGGNGPTFSTVPNSGKWYFEAKQTSADNTNISLGFYGNYTANFDNAWRIIHTNGGGGFIYSFQGPESGSEPSGSVSYTSGDILGIEIDMDNSTLQFHVNGTYATKATGLSFASYAPLWIDFRRQNSSGTNNSWLFNFGQRAFEYTPTSGFKALNTRTLPAPDIADGSEYFDTLLYTGTGGTKAVSGAGFQPDFVWIKNRSRASSSHVLVDAVRGATKTLSSNLTTAEVTTNGTDDFRSFDSNGFTVGDSSNYFVNSIGDTHVAWSWDAGASQGFDIVSYTGNGVNGRGISHSLGVTPAFIIVKNRDSAEAWAIWHQGLDSAIKYLTFTTAAAGSASAIFGGGANEQLPDSTNFYIGSNGMVNANGDDYIAYCFAEVESYSKFGSFTGNGVSDGPFVALPFTPAFVMTKNTSSGQDWQIRDNQRLGYNPADRTLAPNDPRTENGAASSYEIDLLSNGFKIRGGLAAINGSGNTIVFAAFAENPFGGDGVSPATAR